MIRGFGPRRLATRTALLLLLGLAVVQGGGLTINALDRTGLQQLVQLRDLAARLMTLYRTIVLTPAAQREETLAALHLPPGFSATLSDAPPDGMLMAPPPLLRQLRAEMALNPLPPALRPRDVVVLGSLARHRMRIGLHLPEGAWLDVAARVRPPRPWQAPGFLAAFLLMTLLAAVLAVWAVRRLIAPLATLAAAAERLGRDVNAPPLPEDGPAEIAAAAAAFNLMAERIRRFVQDRTLMLSAIGHDLRTPITRLKLRAEFLDDDESRRKMLADLDELEAMIAATLAFGRDASSSEPVTPLDLAVLARTVLDEAADARPECAERLEFDGPEHLTIRARSIALKRALANLVGNALKYGGNARITLARPADGMVRLTVEDDGPGISPAELARVFEPFQRLETSRNRETGGVGLGLPITRNILRAHGGDVQLANRPTGGLCATVTLPV